LYLCPVINERYEMKNYQALLMFIVGGGVAYTLAIGYLQTVIQFEDVDNEMALFILAQFLMLGGLMNIDVRKLIKALG